MLRYICKRVVGVIPTLIIVVTFVFFFVRLIPGDPARQVAGPQATKEDVELVREQLGLNKPLPQQYISYVTGLVKGDLGTSLRTKRPVLTEVQGRYMNTVQLTLLSLTWSVIAGVLIGVWSGRNRSKWQDYTGMTVAVSGISMPSFWIGFMLIMVAAHHRGRLLQEPDSAVHHAGSQHCGHYCPLYPFLCHRGAEGGLRAYGQGQRPAGKDGYLEACVP